MHMSTDQELLTEVRAVLHEEVVDVTAGPALLAGVRRKHKRRALTRRLVFVASAAAAAVAVAVPLAVPSEPPVNAAHVMESTTSALDGVLDDVVYERAVVTEGDKYSKPGEEAVYERWLAADGSTFRLRVTVAGQPVVDLSRDSGADVFVDYQNRTYRAVPGSEVSPGEQDDVWTPKEIQQAIAHGEITVVGPEEVSGKPAVKLHAAERKGSVPMDLWVDATTYLPVRWQWQQEGSSPFDVTWLPPTPANLAQLTTVIPDGFAEQK
jgi:hypothetical protein